MLNKRSITVTIQKNDYEIAYPNTGQQIDIEILKAKISDGNYDSLRFSGNPLFQEQADRIDMIATFTTLIPNLKQDMNVKSFFDLAEEESNELMEVYNEQFIPWFIEIKKSIKQAMSSKKKQEEKDKVNRESNVG